jgi:uncharacterized membrane protein YgcG
MNYSFILARGKKNKKNMGPLLLGVGAKILIISKLALLAVGLLTLKALAVSKLALLLAGFTALQKVLGGGGLGSFGGKNSFSGGSSGWNSGGSGYTSGVSAGFGSSGSGGSASYYRSFDAGSAADAHEMAYQAQAPQAVSQ